MTTTEIHRIVQMISLCLASAGVALWVEWMANNRKKWYLGLAPAIFLSEIVLFYATFFVVNPPVNTPVLIAISAAIRMTAIVLAIGFISILAYFASEKRNGKHK